MFKMISAVALGLITASSVYAFGNERTLLVCRDLHGVADHAYTLTVTQYGCFQAPAPGTLNCHFIDAPVAQLQEQTIAGLRSVDSYVVAFSQANRPGAPKQVNGKDRHGNVINVEIVTDARPTPAGFYSRLTAETPNGRVAAEMGCRFIKN